MARGKRFSVHDLYPEDYCFDYDTFEEDPENYKFAAEDNAYLNAIELERYEDTVPMPPMNGGFCADGSSPATASMTIPASAISVSPSTIRPAIS